MKGCFLSEFFSTPWLKVCWFFSLFFRFLRRGSMIETGYHGFHSKFRVQFAKCKRQCQLFFLHCLSFLFFLSKVGLLQTDSSQCFDLYQFFNCVEKKVGQRKNECSKMLFIWHTYSSIKKVVHGYLISRVYCMQ